MASLKKDSYIKMARFQKKADHLKAINSKPGYLRYLTTVNTGLEGFFLTEGEGEGGAGGVSFVSFS